MNNLLTAPLRAVRIQYRNSLSKHNILTIARAITDGHDALHSKNYMNKLFHV